MKKFDDTFRTESIKLIAGVDEVGRGPLAGPVVAASVVFPADVNILGVNDSKQLTEREREILFPEIISNAISYGVSAVGNNTIDSINILQASLLAMKQSINKLVAPPDLILVDGNKSFISNVNVIPVVKGDSKSFSIAAASIIAKVIRDRLMKRLSTYFPEYLWDKNKGYPTREHIEAVKLFGPTVLHRRSFLLKILNVRDQVLTEHSPFAK